MHKYLLWLIQVLLICCACKLDYLSVNSRILVKSTAGLFCVSSFIIFFFYLTDLISVANQRYLVFRFLQESFSKILWLGWPF